MAMKVLTKVTGEETIYSDLMSAVFGALAQVETIAVLNYAVRNSWPRNAALRDTSHFCFFVKS